MKTLLLILFSIISFTAVGQKLLSIETKNHCFYERSLISPAEELYDFGTEHFVQSMVDEICIKGHVKQNFRLISSNVPNIAAIIDRDSGYLLFNPNFFYSNQNAAISYALLAHEIAHLVKHHDLKNSLRFKEECIADEFMGYVMMQIGSAPSLEPLLFELQKRPFFYSTIVPWTEREQAIRRGWIRALGLINGLGFGFNPNDIENLPLPKFDLFSCLPTTPPLSTSKINSCKTLGKLDTQLQKALYTIGYKEFTYFAVPGGYAMTTNIEQFNPDGTSVLGEGRWQDCPPRGQFKSLLDYFEDLVHPVRTRFRLFSIIVSSNPSITPYQKGCIPLDDIPDWLRGGGGWLPDSLAKLSFLPKYKVRVMVFEYFIPATTLKAAKECQKPLPVAVHLDKSGILSALR